jgi:hypothetical protein
MGRDLITVLLLGALGGVMLWSLLAFQRWLDAFRVVRRRVGCPVHGTAADVDFLVDATGPVVYRDVVDCSLLPPGRGVECGKVCRSISVAPFGEDVAEPAVRAR